MSDDPLLPLVTAAVTPAGLPESFTVPQAVAFARDLVLHMYDRPVILKKHNLSEAQAKVLESNEYFLKLQEQLSIEWNSPRTATERLALHTAIGLETVLPDAIARVKVKNEPLQGVAQMVKVLAEIAGANAAAKQRQGAPGEKFTITINLGADKEVYEKTKPVITVDQAPGEPEEVRYQSEGPSPPAEVRPQLEGFGSLLSLQTEPEPT